MKQIKYIKVKTPMQIFIVSNDKIKKELKKEIFKW